MNLDHWGNDVFTIKGRRMRISWFGNLLLPRIDSWIYGYRHVTSAIYKNKPIPQNVISLEEYLENEVEDLY